MLNMLTLCRREQVRARLVAACSRYASQSLPAEYTEEPQYPPIKNLTFASRKKEEKETWHEEIQNVKTVEEKMIKINMPRFYGYKVIQFNEEFMPYNCLPAMQHYTRTIFEDMKVKSEPSSTNDSKDQSNAKLDAFVQLAKSDVQDSLEYAYDFFSIKYPNLSNMDPQEKERAFTQLVVEQVNRALINALSADCAHLQEVEVDNNPRHEAFWFVGGIDPPKNVVKSKEGRDWQKDMAHDPVDRAMQYKCQPYLALRHRHQLPTWKNETETVNAELAKTVPRYNFDPRTLGYTAGYQHGTNIPGFWPGSPNPFGYISYHSRAHMLIRPEIYGEEDMKEALKAQAIQASYGWLLAQANYNGFNTFSDITYPMNTQTIITNGRDWSFFEYQLNTLLVHSHHVDENPRVNFCRGTDEMQLFQDFDDKGKCIGFNEETLQHLVQFYTNAPTIKRPIAELQPYLGAEEKLAADYADDDKREFLEKTFKHMVSNRPRHLEIPEIYLWEKIYKIDNKTRQMEARRRFFELDINPWKRTLDQHQKVYIPRALRPDVPKSKKRETKWKKTYYP